MHYITTFVRKKFFFSNIMYMAFEIKNKKEKKKTSLRLDFRASYVINRPKQYL